jgi:ABC-type transporter lipoprotein component MlaA
MATLKEVLAKIPELTEEVKTKILNEKYDDYKPLEEFNKVYNSLENERREHKATKTILEAFEGITPDEAKEFKVKVTEKIKEEDAKAPSDIAKQHCRKRTQISKRKLTKQVLKEA